MSFKTSLRAALGVKKAKPSRSYPKPKRSVKSVPRGGNRG